MEPYQKEMKEPLIENDNLLVLFKELFDVTNIVSKKSHNLWEKKLEGENVPRLLKVNPSKGLNMEDMADIAERKRLYGTNETEETEEIPFSQFILDCLEDRILRILIVASIVSLIIGVAQEGFDDGWIEGTAIFLSVFIVVTITSVNNWSKDRQFNKLNRESKKKNVKVRRNGIKMEIDETELLAGDLLYVEIGQIVNIDGILIEGAVSMDESSATGESCLIKKTVNLTDNSTPFIISDTKTQEGEGIILVCAVGRNTGAEASKEILAAKQGEDEANKTPLEKQLEELAQKIEVLGIFMALLVGLMMILKYMAVTYAAEKPFFTASLARMCLNAIIISITVLVVAIPEGLPMAVTISLAYSVFKMKEENNLVRNLEASETMGNCNTICTDKTGTLTLGEMSINSVFTMEKSFKSREALSIPENARVLLGEVIGSNVTASAEKVDEKMKAKGNMTEVSLLQYLLDYDFKYNLRENDTPFLRLPFSSEYKIMITVWELEDKSYRMYVKGAPERLFDKCSQYYGQNGEVKKLGADAKALFGRQQEIYSYDSMRTLIVGYKDIDSKQISEALERFPEKDIHFYLEILNNITLLALLGIADAPREDVPQAIQLCHDAGVNVIMVTGDNIKTAVAISRNVKIISTEESTEAMRYIKWKETQLKEENVKQDMVNGREDMTAADFRHPIALDGIDFREMTGGYKPIIEGEGKEKTTKYVLNDIEKFTNTVKNLKIIARASPDDKFLLVMGLKRIDNNIIAVTGDGTNDAPALKQSHVGFAMGIRGTDIAKEASDIVLLNDSFSSVITAIKYGRNVYDCIRKFLQFQLTCNIVAVFMTIMGGILLSDSPLNAIQMLWVNLIMDSFASLALATEPPTEKLLYRKPCKKNQSIITGTMGFNIITQAIFQIVILTIIIYYGDIIFEVPSDRELDHLKWNNVNGYHFTIFFNIFVYMQVFNSVNARKLLIEEINVFDGIFNNSFYLAIQVLILVGQICLVTFGGRALRVHPLSLNQHLVCLAIASITLLVNLVVKLVHYQVDLLINIFFALLFLLSPLSLIWLLGLSLTKSMNFLNTIRMRIKLLLLDLLKE